MEIMTLLINWYTMKQKTLLDSNYIRGALELKTRDSSKKLGRGTKKSVKNKSVFRTGLYWLSNLNTSLGRNVP